MQQLVATIQIKGKGMVCSQFYENSFYVGCRDGTLLEISLTNDFELLRELKTDCIITTIACVTRDLILIGQTQGSGWADSRGKVSLIRKTDQESTKKIENNRVGIGFTQIGMSILPVGDINQIVINRQNEITKYAELILACQKGLYFAGINL
jgi:hypothetical protein